MRYAGLAASATRTLDLFPPSPPPLLPKGDGGEIQEDEGIVKGVDEEGGLGGEKGQGGVRKEGGTIEEGAERGGRAGGNLGGEGGIGGGAGGVGGVKQSGGKGDVEGEEDMSDPYSVRYSKFWQAGGLSGLDLHEDWGYSPSGKKCTNGATLSPFSSLSISRSLSLSPSLSLDK